VRHSRGGRRGVQVGVEPLVRLLFAPRDEMAVAVPPVRA
jgi:hypothetical protein